MGVGLAYLLLLIPEPQPPAPAGAGKSPFAWNRDDFWTSLEKQFLEMKQLGCEELEPRINESLSEIQRTFDVLATSKLAPDDPAFDRLEAGIFNMALMVCACPKRMPDLMQVFSRMRLVVKRQSELWPQDSAAGRARLYRSLYGGRAAVEQAMLQSGGSSLELPLVELDEPSLAPSAVVRGVTVRSGDILVSRGGAATSALIARGNDFTGNFSHIALVHIDQATRAVSVIEAHIESGVVVAPIEKYLSDTKLRIMGLRLRSDHPAVRADPLLPHKAATHALEAATARHIPYDFAMDYKEPGKQFCSEVASSAYERQGVKLWMHLSYLSTPGLTSWLSVLGVRRFETQEPSDLEYDPQVRVIAEWRDPETLFNDHADNAVIDVMLERAEAGEPLDYNLWLLPVVRLVKAWSVLNNWCGVVGPVPEGMSATTALRAQRIAARHAEIKKRLLASAKKFKAENGYTPPYWVLLRLAREAQSQ
ncbi:MAG TPA: YiiX/YebB-like N1pC/P60 family cysteine hydrolase [Roseimicrobium sp.]|nr:YiiX/YebB-like N1pC/P60 family cysteine hydrolase [Roseimicrobium sp.]